MCHFGDLRSCFYYLQRILHVSLVLNGPLCYNLLYTFYKRKKGEKEQPNITKYHCIMSNIGQILSYLQHGESNCFQITWPNQEKLIQN